MWRYWQRIAFVCIPHLCLTTPLMVLSTEFCNADSDQKKRNDVPVIVVKKFNDRNNRFNAISECDRQTDGQFTFPHQYRAWVCWGTIKTTVGWGKSELAISLNCNSTVLRNMKETTQCLNKRIIWRRDESEQLRLWDGRMSPNTRPWWCYERRYYGGGNINMLKVVVNIISRRRAAVCPSVTLSSVCAPPIKLISVSSTRPLRAD